MFAVRKRIRNEEKKNELLPKFSSVFLRSLPCLLWVFRSRVRIPWTNFYHTSWPTMSHGYIICIICICKCDGIHRSKAGIVFHVESSIFDSTIVWISPAMGNNVGSFGAVDPDAICIWKIRPIRSDPSDSITISQIYSQHWLWNAFWENILRKFSWNRIGRVNVILWNFLKI